MYIVAWLIDEEEFFVIHHDRNDAVAQALSVQRSDTQVYFGEITAMSVVSMKNMDGTPLVNAASPT
jgi:hypothetical protein